jgi:hypothetical protein
MSNIFVTDIIGTGTYAVPTDDTELASASSGLNTLLGGVANLTYDRVLAWVEDSGGPGGAEGNRTLNCLIEKFTYLTDECPSEANVDTMIAAIESTLEADANITSVDRQDVHIFQAGAYFLWNRDSAGGFLYPNTATDDVAVGPFASPNGKWFDDGDLVLGTDAMVGAEQLYILDDDETANNVGARARTEKDSTGTKAGWTGFVSEVQHTGAGPGTLYLGFASSNTYNNAAADIDDDIGFVCNPTVTAVNSFDRLTGFFSQPTIAAGQTVTRYKGVSIDGINGAGTVTTSTGIEVNDVGLNSTTTYGIEIDAQTGTTARGIYCDDSIELTGTIVIGENADHTVAPAAGTGLLWVRSDTPNRVIFTDDAGTDQVLQFGWTESEVIYVAKFGSDANDGQSLTEPKLTVGAAITAAAALTPSATNPIVIYVYPGVYSEQIVLSSDYVSLFGVGGPDSVIIEDDTDASQVLRMGACDNIEVRNIHFRGITNNVDAITCAQFTLNNIFRNCKFTSKGTGRSELDGGFASNRLVMDFYNCVFTHADNDGVNDPVAIFMDDATLNFNDCTFEGRGTVNNGVISVYKSCKFRAATSAAATPIWTFTSAVTMLGCDAENTNVGNVFELDVAGCQFLGGRLWAGSDASARELSSTFTTKWRVACSGVVMNNGMAGTIYRDELIHYVGDSGDCDFHVSLEAACDGLLNTGGTVYLMRDVTVGSNIDNQHQSLTIDGMNNYSIDRGSDALLFEQNGFDPQVFTLKNVEIIQGRIEWDRVQAGVLNLVQVTGGTRIIIDNYVAGKEVNIQNCDITVAATDQPFIDFIGGAACPLIIRQSRLEGNGTQPAIDLDVSATALDVSYSVLTEGSTAGTPISNPPGAVSMISHHNLYSTSPFGGNLSNSVTNPYDSPIGSAGASPWTSAAGVIYPATGTDDVAIGSTTMAGAERLYILDEDETGNIVGARARVEKDSTGTKAQWTGYVAEVQHTGTGAGTLYIGFASSNTFNNASADIDDDIGFVYNPTITAVNSFDRAAGLLVQPTVAAGQTLTTYKAVSIDGVNGTGTITTSTGVDINDIGLNSTTTYGIYIAAQTGTTTWGIYQAGTGEQNYFAGQATFGTTSPLTTRRVYVEVDDGESYTRGVEARFVKNGASGAQSFTGFEASVRHTGNQAGLSYFGYSMDINFSPSATQNLTRLVGYESAPGSGSNATISEIVGFRATTDELDGAITNWYGLEVEQPNTVGTGITNAYGVYIEDQSGNTLSYGIYQEAATDSNYFAGHIGVAVTPSASYYVAVQDNEDTAIRAGFRSELVKDGAGNNKDFTGYQAFLTHSGTGSMSNARGYVFSLSQSNTGDISSCIAFQATATSSASGGTITTYQAFRADGSVTSGQIATAYGFRAASMEGNAGQSWGFYQEGASDRNYFAGDTGLGESNPQYILDVDGDVRFQDHMSIGPVVTPDSERGIDLRIEAGSAPASTYGVDVLCYKNTTGTATSMYGFRADGLVNAGTANDFRHFAAAGVGGSGTYTAVYGLFIDSQYSTSNPTATNTYGIYQIGSNDKNFFQGSTGFGVGVTSPSYTIDVNGDINVQSGNVYRFNGSAGLTGTYTFGGGSSGDIASMTFAGGILIGVTTVP